MLSLSLRLRLGGLAAARRAGRQMTTLKDKELGAERAWANEHDAQQLVALRKTLAAKQPAAAGRALPELDELAASAAATRAAAMRAIAIAEAAEAALKEAKKAGGT
jgi:hypothetical protein